PCQIVVPSSLETSVALSALVSSSALSFHFFFQGHVDPRDLHSFPTRRSSDLLRAPAKPRRSHPQRRTRNRLETVPARATLPATGGRRAAESLACGRDGGAFLAP